MLNLPISVHGRVSDIWRSYLGERLLQDLGMRVAFSPPLVEQKRNIHNYLADFDAEIPLYEQTEALLETLSGWVCSARTLPERMELLYIELYERGFIEISDVFLVQSWLQALERANYLFPHVINTRGLRSDTRLIVS